MTDRPNLHRLSRPELDALCRAQAERIVEAGAEQVSANERAAACTIREEQLRADLATVREQAELNKRNFADMDTLCTRAIEQRDHARAEVTALHAVVEAARAYIAAHDAIDARSEAAVIVAVDARFTARNALRAALAAPPEQGGERE